MCTLHALNAISCFYFIHCVMVFLDILNKPHFSVLHASLPPMYEVRGKVSFHRALSVHRGRGTLVFGRRSLPGGTLVSGPRILLGREVAAPDRIGVLPGQDRSTPLGNRWTLNAVGDTPFAVTQEDFLVRIVFIQEEELGRNVTT